ncbi:MAG: hypothetical protein IJQ21_10465 [Lachnospiraceae bacterium]|nr:hypothetical protein [Lachnospiraceae bacterium]
MKETDTGTVLLYEDPFPCLRLSEKITLATRYRNACHDFSIRVTPSRNFTRLSE